MNGPSFPSGAQPDRRGSFGNLHSGRAPGAAGGPPASGNVGGTSSGEQRNFSHHSQATLPHHYQHFGSSYAAPSSGLRQISMYPSSNHHQYQRFPSEQHLPTFNAPHIRSPPHGYSDSIPQATSPVTPYRHDHQFHYYSTQPATATAAGTRPGSGNANGHVNPGSATLSSPASYGGYPRRRESAPDIAETGTFHHYQPNRSYLGSGADGTSADIIPYLNPAGGSTGLGESSPSQGPTHQYAANPSHGPIPPVTAYPNYQTAPPTSAGRRSRGSTFGSRTTDEDTQTSAGMAGIANSTDDGEGSRPTTADLHTGGEEPVTARDFSKKKPGKTKVGARDESMELDAESGPGFGDLDADEKIDHRKRKRNRTIRSCVPCHNHKRKCDRKRPCGRCTALGLTGTCVYEIDEARDMNDPDVAETDRLRRRIAELEQVVRELRQKAPTKGSAPVTSAPAIAPAPASTLTTTSIPITNADEVAEEAKKRRVVVDRFARFKLDEAKDVENSAASGTITPNFPVWAPHSVVPIRSPVSSRMPLEPSDQDDSGAAGSSKGGERDYRKEPYEAYLLPGEEMTADKTGRKVFLGALTGKTMLRRLRELAETKGDGELLTVPEDVAFTGVFPDMRKTFPFTTIWSHENFSAEIIGLLPNAEQAALLWQAWDDEYSTYIHPFHMPSLHAEYTRFFSMSTAEKMNTPLSSLALFLILCALGCVIRATSAELFGHPDANVARQKPPKTATMNDPKDLTCSRLQSELYLSASFHALRLCAFLANPTIRTIQCQIVLNVYLLTSERAADAWSHCGTLVKQAIALGLHKDPLSMDPNVSMLDAEVRRRIWWSIAGFDCMLCIFFGRPSVISYYTTNLPHDRPDDTLSDAPGSARQLLPPSNALDNTTTEQTYHAAYYQLTIPSLELLDRIFQVDKRITRSVIYGWFSPSSKDQPSREDNEDTTRHTYQEALRLAHDIEQWYSHLPAGVRFNENDSAQTLLSSKSRKQLNQSLMLSMKTHTLIMVLHRPYLRFDPNAYPESSAACFNAAHHILRIYKSMAETKSTLSWSFWTVPYRAFQAGAVCAFLAMRQPGTELAKKCLEDLRGAIDIFQDRLSTWNIMHPVQADLCEGLERLEKLVTAATQQRNSPGQSTADLQRLPPDASSNVFAPSFSSNTERQSVGTPHSHMQGFPPRPNTLRPAGGSTMSYPHSNSADGGGGADHGDHFKFDPSLSAPNFESLTEGMMSGYADFNGPEPLALPGYWASIFGIKMEKEKESSSSGVTMCASQSQGGPE